jgi:hypothetical protein
LCVAILQRVDVRDLVLVFSISVVVHNARQLTIADCADKYLILQMQGAVGWLN